MSREPISELQSLRGLAAMVVVLHHCFMVFDLGAVGSAIEVVLNAHAAVVLFFVLSGFVLTRSLTTTALDGKTFVRFWTRRAFRIYPALWVGVLFGLAYYVLLASWPIRGASSWFWDRYVPGTATWSDLALSFSGMSLFLLPVLWTIVVEIAASIVIPGIAWALLRPSRLAWLLILLTVASFGIHGGMKLINVYLVDFAIGASVLLLPPLTKRAAGWILLSATPLLFLARQIAPFGYHDPLASLMEAIAAAAMVYALSSGHFPRVRARPLVLIGDWSYSIYLLHMPIMYMLAKVISRWLDGSLFAQSLALAACTCAITIFISRVVYERVELPGIALGRRITQVLSLRLWPA